MQMIGVPAIVQVFSSACSGSSVSQICPACSIRVRPSSVSSEGVNRTIQSQFAAIVEAIHAISSPAITQGDTVSQRRITSRRDVQAVPCSQLQPGRAEMQLNAIFVGMADPEHVI
ncbi:hypothetical protein [Halocynthiibacter styelae]|uniref:Uncharacterized protein n=1 Tax=Halocynthiibacter styelae TaxID=2761955 RepID=A0A8J7LLB7_9RHOB|nr:hypothetical protein [Paenihalocynthiibacter styelae]MBI1494379.1 hypothetical protein [Paenihalocynthiibacter styelae]